MINLNKDNKKRRSGASMKFLCTVIVTVVALAAIGFMGYSSEKKSVSELTNKINTAYENGYSIFIDGVEV